MKSLCKTKRFEDWWDAHGKWLTLRYEIALKVYEYERFDHYIERFGHHQTVKSIRKFVKEIEISCITYRKYKSILIEAHLIPLIFPCVTIH